MSIKKGYLSILCIALGGNVNNDPSPVLLSLLLFHLATIVQILRIKLLGGFLVFISKDFHWRKHSILSLHTVCFSLIFSLSFLLITFNHSSFLPSLLHFHLLSFLTFINLFLSTITFFSPRMLQFLPSYFSFLSPILLYFLQVTLFFPFFFRSFLSALFDPFLIFFPSSLPSSLFSSLLHPFPVFLPPSFL